VLYMGVLSEGGLRGVSGDICDKSGGACCRGIIEHTVLR
jgi:hypothetical protein